LDNLQVGAIDPALAGGAADGGEDAARVALAALIGGGAHAAHARPATAEGDDAHGQRAPTPVDRGEQGPRRAHEVADAAFGLLRIEALAREAGDPGRAGRLAELGG